MLAKPFTEAEIGFLAAQDLGRLATATSAGSLQVKPVVFWYNAAEQTIDIGGHNLASSRKFRNVQENGLVAFVVDDLLSRSPFRVRGIEVRGSAEACTAAQPETEGPSTVIIRIRPHRVICWGIDATEPGVFGGPGRHSRTV
jgi:pyridoxamine 5'-phosphate oxidase family protein